MICVALYKLATIADNAFLTKSDLVLNRCLRLHIAGISGVDGGAGYNKSLLWLRVCLKLPVNLRLFQVFKALLSGTAREQLYKAF